MIERRRDRKWCSKAVEDTAGSDTRETTGGERVRLSAQHPMNANLIFDTGPF